MGDGIAQQIENARVFLRKLAENNNRDWFQDHKQEYETEVKIPGNAIGAEMAQGLTRMTGKEMSHKLFRINRDVRFSKDKTPYNTHLHLLWSGGSGPGFFFGVSPEYVTAGCGVIGLQKEALTGYREAVDTDGIKLATNIQKLKNKGYRLDDPQLKRVPAPYNKDHPQGALLRRKDLSLWYDFEPNKITKDRLMERFAELLPVFRFLEQIG